MRLLPAFSPDDALNARRARMTPSTPQELTDVFQGVRVGREIDVPVDHGQHVDHPADNGLERFPLLWRQARGNHMDRQIIEEYVTCLQRLRHAVSGLTQEDLTA